MVTKLLSRSLRLLYLLRQSDGLSLQQLALTLNCSHRTAAADLEVLKTCGFEVVRSAEGYRILATDKSSEGSCERAAWLTLCEAIDAVPLLRSEGEGAGQLTLPAPGRG